MHWHMTLRTYLLLPRNVRGKKTWNNQLFLVVPMKYNFLCRTTKTWSPKSLSHHIIRFPIPHHFFRFAEIPMFCVCCYRFYAKARRVYESLSWIFSNFEYRAICTHFSRWNVLCLQTSRISSTACTLHSLIQHLPLFFQEFGRMIVWFIHGKYFHFSYCRITVTVFPGKRHFRRWTYFTFYCRFAISTDM